MKNGVIGITLVVLLAGCGSTVQTVPDPAKVADEVKAVIHTQVEAYAARDPAKAASIMAPDVLGMFHGESNTKGKEASAASMRAQMADPLMKLDVTEESVDVASSGDLAVYHATYHFTYTDPATKGPAIETGNWVAVLKRQGDGTMKMIKDIVADSRPGT